MVIEDAHAVVIGIARYQRTPPLRITQDAQDVAAVLQDPACCGYPASAVRMLVDEAATRTAIFDALDALGRATRPGSTVFIYYSGHGAHAAAPGGGDHRYYLLPVDAAAGSRDDLEHTAISNIELSARLRAIPAGRLTLVLDCCRAAELAELQLAALLAPLAQGRGRAVLAASRATDAAYALPGQRNSTMTRHLVDGLRGAAPGVAGVIRICDLFHHVQQRVAAEPLEQHPVFKAELEENYPIAQLRGGAPASLVLPPPPDDFAYDAFLSFRREDPGDRAWVTDLVVPYLEGLGLRLCLEHRDFRLGASHIEEIERAVTTSRYTVSVFTPAYFEDPFQAFESLLATHHQIEVGKPRFIPLIRKPCRLVLHLRMTEALDVSADSEVPAALERLAVALRQPPRPRLAA